MKESDIKVLNFIIEKVLETKGRINYTQVVSSGLIMKESQKEQILEFRRLLKIIENINCAKVLWSDFFDTVDINEHTQDFKDRGGFDKYFQDELDKIEKENEREKIEIELAKSNLEANELNKSIAAKNETDKKRNKTERIINISLGVLNLVLLVVQILISLYKD